MHHGPGEKLGMTQKFYRRGHVPGLDLGADIGAGNPNPIEGLLRHHRPGKASQAAIARQPQGIARPSRAEPEILAADEAHSPVIPAKHIQKVPPGAAVHFLVKGQGHHGFRPETLPEKPLPVSLGVDKPGRLPQHQRIRVDAEGNHAEPASGLRGQLPAGLQKRGVADVHPVKKAQGVNCLFFHPVVLYLKKALDR